MSPARSALLVVCLHTCVRLILTRSPCFHHCSSFFSRSSFALFAALFAAWCLTAVPWAYLLSTLVNRTKPATIVSYLLLILSVVASMVMCVTRAPVSGFCTPDGFA